MSESKLSVSKRGFVMGLVVTAATAGATTTDVKAAVQHELPGAADNGVHRIFHVVAGNDDWEPSMQEMSDLAQLFSDAIRQPSSTIVTRPGVTVSVIEWQESTPARVG